MRRSVSSPAARRPRLAAGAASLLLATAALTGCGDDAKPVAATPAATGPAFHCPLTATVVGDGLRSDATLISKARQGCLYGDSPSGGRSAQATAADPDQPSAWIGLLATDAAGARAALAARDPAPEIVDRPNLVPGAFQTSSATRAGTRVETTFTDQLGQVWTVVVRLPPGDENTPEEAQDRADSIVDALNATSAPPPAS